ncbi:MAG TPA: PPC domain-containing protein, partial [Pirellulales bacterium]|nr:PPC domain-containing protein [Pirellulales bacterium]
TINGSCRDDEVDVYGVEARKGQRLTAEVEAMRLGHTNFDPFIAILDRNGRELITSDDDALVLADAVASIVVPEDGKYFVLVRDATFNAPSSNPNYRLHVGRYPQPRAVFPAGGKLGETVKVKLIGDIKGDTEMKVVLPKKHDARFAIYAKDDTGTAAFGNPFVLSTLDARVEAEPNDEIAKATPFEAPRALDGVLSKPGDMDCYKFTAKKGQQYAMRVHGRSLRSPIDSVLKVLKAKGGNSVIGSDDTGNNNPDSSLRFTAPEDGEYIVTITDMLGQGGKEYVYRIDVTPIEPEITAALPELRRYTDVVAVVPRGNRMAVTMRIDRRDCNGDVVLDLDDLPKGVKAEVVKVPANQSTVPVLLKAADDAPLDGAAVRVIPRSKVKMKDNEVAVAGAFEQRSIMIRVLNNKFLYTWPSDRMATVVTEHVPFQIEIVEPKAPLVRNGSMELKVRAIRDKGFTGPIRMRMAYNPSGVGSSGSAMIPEGKDEGIMPLTANKDAEFGAWKITIVGAASSEAGEVEAATQLATLHVAESFFNLTTKPSAVEQGKQEEMIIDIEQLTPFEGKAKLEVVGLPNEATAEPVEFDKSTEQVKVKIRTSAKTPAGRHKSLMLRATPQVEGEPVTHIQGPVELRVDAPLVKKSAKTAKEPAKK